jgi:hypothetical protein
MAARLHLKIGVVAEQDRLSSSADSILVTEPGTGSRARSKGSLYVVVTARTGSGGRPREAAALVAETIRREYYYDESAGIPVCLDKAVRSANRRLRHQREGHGLAPGSIGAAIAVIRVNELYVATIGDGDAYLVRQARLLMPEHQPSSGLPAPDGMHIDVWRGEFAIGDSLILVARNLSEVVGTEEIKNAVVTLHPQSAVEHLHHLFVAGSGDGSDAVLAIEATEIASSRAEKRLVPVTPAEPLAGSLAASGGRDPLSNAALAVSGGARRMRTAVGEAFGGLVDKMFDLLPQRSAKFKRVKPLVARRNSQRRYATALLMVLAFILLAGTAAWALSEFRPKDRDIPTINNADQALTDAEGKINRALGAGDVPIGDERQARDLLQNAWKSLDQAQTAGVPRTRIDSLRARAANGLDVLYRTLRPNATPIIKFATALPDADPRDLVLGPPRDPDAVYLIDRKSKSVVRVELATGRSSIVVKAGDGAGSGIGQPSRLGTGGQDLLIVDARGDLWRWRPSDATGRGTLTKVTVAGDSNWGNDVIDFATFLVNPDAGLYNLYVIDPSANQILRYAPTADGSGFSRSTDYLVAPDAEQVAAFKGLLIDGDIYTLSADQASRHENGRKTTDFKLADPPDNGDVRPGHTFELFDASGQRKTGKLYVYDSKYDRIIVYGKNGTYQLQYVARGTVPPFHDVRGMVVRERPGGQPPVLLWVTPTAVYQTDLADATAPGASPSPSGSTAPSGSPGSSPKSPGP